MSTDDGVFEAEPIILQLHQGGYFRQLILGYFVLLGDRIGSGAWW